MNRSLGAVAVVIALAPLGGTPASAATYERLPWSAPGGTIPSPRGMSDDGRYVVYTGVAGDTPSTNFYPETYLYDRVTRRSEVVSLSSTGKPGGPSGTAAKDEWETGSVSGDGRFVVFVSGARNLVPSDTNGSKDVFLRDRKARTTTRINVDSRGNEMAANRPGGGDQQFDAAISRDGSRVLFHTAYDLRGDGAKGDTWYVYHRVTRALAPVDRAGSTKEGSGAATWGGSAALSRDGRYVVFSTTKALVAADTDTQHDVYRRDVVGGVTTLVTDNAVDATAPAATPAQAVRPDVTAYDQATVDSTGQWVAFNALSVRLGQVPGDEFTGKYESRVLARNVKTGTLKVLARSEKNWAAIPAIENSPSPRFGPVISDDATGVLYVSPRPHFSDVTVPADAADLTARGAPVLYRVDVTTGTAVAMTTRQVYCTAALPCMSDHPEQGEPPLFNSPPEIRSVVAAKGARFVAFLTDLPVTGDDVDVMPDVYVWRG